jgi:hypothetical protein
MSNTRYQLCFEKENICIGSRETLEEIIILIYQSISKKIELKHIKLNMFHYGVIINSFKLKFNNFIYLYNENESIKLTTLAPQHYILESLLMKKNIPKTNTEKPKINTEKPKVVKPKINTEKPPTPEEDPEFTKFKLDKKNYFLIKERIETNYFIKENIHPVFTKIYDIFEVMDEFNIIDKSDSNLEKEFEQFKILYEEAKNEEKEEPILSNSELNKIFDNNIKTYSEFNNN